MTPTLKNIIKSKELSNKPLKALNKKYSPSIATEYTYTYQHT